MASPQQDSFARLFRGAQNPRWRGIGMVQGVQEMVLVGERVGKGGRCLGPSQVLEGMPEPDA